MVIQRLKQKLTQEKFAPICLLTFFSLLVLILVSKNSPLYPRNDWVDQNVFFTMGRGWLHGMIPYKDLFDQKGPILYFIYLIAAVIGNHYWSIFILEWINLSLVLVIAYQSARLATSRINATLFAMLAAVFSVLSPFFVAGGSAEEWMLPSIWYCIYLIIKLDRTEFVLSNRELFLAGLALGYVFWIKYTASGAWIGFIIATAGVYLWRKQIKRLGVALRQGVLGVLAVSLPILAYFSITGSLKQLGFAYFYANLKFYPSTTQLSFPAKLYNAFQSYFAQFTDHALIGVCVVVGIFALIVTTKPLRSTETTFIYFSSYFCLVAMTLAGRSNYAYYWLIILPFVATGLLPFVAQIRDNFSWGKAFFAGCACLLLAMVMNTNLQYSKLYPYNPSIDINLKSKESGQDKFSKIITAMPHSTVLEYGGLDLGIYQATDKLPTTRFFFNPNIPRRLYPAIMDSQDQQVRAKKYDFLVCSYYSYQKESDVVPSFLKQNYRQVSRSVQMLNGAHVTMILFQKRA